MTPDADGIAPGPGHVDPHGYVRLHDAGGVGDTAAARVEQRWLTELFGIIEVADRGRIGRMSGAPGAFKAALVARGVISHPYTQAPLPPRTDAEREAVADRVAAAGLAPVAQFPPCPRRTMRRGQDFPERFPPGRDSGHN